jgi:hypothetical protein
MASATLSPARTFVAASRLLAPTQFAWEVVPMRPVNIFTTDRDIDGGYILNTFEPRNQRLTPVSVSKDETSVLAFALEAESWDLIEIKDV